MLSLWNSFVPLTATDREISRQDLFDRVFTSTWSDLMDNFNSPVSGILSNITEDGVQYSMDLPGVQIADLDVRSNERTITVHATRKTPTSSYTIDKSFIVPKEYDADNVEAALLDGVLTLSFKKSSKEEIKVKQIEVKSAQPLLNK